MIYNKKYVTEINDTHYIWFNEELNKDVRFDIEQYPENEKGTQYLKKNFQVVLSDENAVIYNNCKYIYFANWIYIVDTKTAKMKNIVMDVYNPLFLNKCIVATKKKNSRRDELIQINVEDNTISSLGFMKNENMSR